MRPWHNLVVTGTEGKRSKLETETSNSPSGTWSKSDEQVDRVPSRRVSSGQPDAYSIGHTKSDVTPPIGPARLPSGPSYPSNSTSPVAYPISGLNSPRTG